MNHGQEHKNRGEWALVANGSTGLDWPVYSIPVLMATEKMLPNRQNSRNDKHTFVLITSLFYAFRPVDFLTNRYVE